MRTTLIVNPYASRVTAELAQQVARVLDADQTLFTERAGHATELARAADHDRIVVYSGDGGFNEVLNGARPDTVLGFVPGGGTSVLPRALGLQRDPLAAAARIALGRPRRIALGRANGRRFGFAAGIGLDAELIRRHDALGRRADGKRPGDIVFAWTAVKTLAEKRIRFDPVVEIEGHGRAAFAVARARRAASTCSRRAPCARAHSPGQSATWPPAAHGCRSSSCTTPTGSSFAATRRRRSSSTARISVTSSRSSSKPSATRSRF